MSMKKCTNCAVGKVSNWFWKVQVFFLDLQESAKYGTQCEKMSLLVNSEDPDRADWGKNTVYCQNL